MFTALILRLLCLFLSLSFRVNAKPAGISGLYAEQDRSAELTKRTVPEVDWWGPPKDEKWMISVKRLKLQPALRQWASTDWLETIKGKTALTRNDSRGPFTLTGRYIFRKGKRGPAPDQRAENYLGPVDHGVEYMVTYFGVNNDKQRSKPVLKVEMQSRGEEPRTSKPGSELFPAQDSWLGQIFFVPGKDLPTGDAESEGGGKYLTRQKSQLMSIKITKEDGSPLDVGTKVLIQLWARHNTKAFYLPTSMKPIPEEGEGTGDQSSVGRPLLSQSSPIQPGTGRSDASSASAYTNCEDMDEPNAVRMGCFFG
ncbi:MAG: hypothetical protein M1825_004954 [Sarcosagium campestre]|nr:MAG: hypothetical protein M1825_004954 [Sarcosagium campestre]